MNYSAFEQALNEATAGLREIEAESAKLKFRKEQLQALVRNLLSVLPVEASARKTAESSLGDLGPDGQAETSAECAPKATWMLARDVLAKSKGALTVPEIHNILLNTEPNVPAQDAIRVAMLRKPDIFIKKEKQYALTASQFEAADGEPYQW